MLLQLLSIWIAILVSVAHSATPPIEAVGSKFFADGNQFYIKGVNYNPLNFNTSDPLVDATKCGISAAAIKALGANTIRISTFKFDASQSRDSCIKAFADNDIYLIIGLTHDTIDLSDGVWNMDKYNRFTTIIDAFQGYSNILGFEIWAPSYYENSTDPVPAMKAAFRDLRAYREAKGYRSIPIGLTLAIGLIVNGEQWVNYTFCPAPASNGIAGEKATPEFYSMVYYRWCGESTYQSSYYNLLTDAYGVLGVPIFLAKTGCNTVLPRTFGDQAAIFGPEMVDIWSGAIIYEWGAGSGSYDLFSTSAGSPTPTPNADYSYLSSQWATLKPTGTTSPTNAIKTFPICPTSTSSWPFNAFATLPTIAGLAVVTASGKTSSASSPSGSSGSTISGDGSTTESHHSLPKSAGIGIGVGVGSLLIIAIVLFVMFCRRRRSKQRGTPTRESDTHEKPEMYAGPVNTTIAGIVKPKSELQAGTAVHRKSTLSELHHEKPTLKGHSYELQGAAGANAPWLHNESGYRPPELNSIPIFEADQSIQQQVGGGELKTNDNLSLDGDSTVAANMNSKATTTSQRPAAILSGDDESGLTQEADIAVQELGLISVRKRNFVATASTLGVRPEDLQGKKGEEYIELLQQEQRVRGRLEEIEKQRRHLVQEQNCTAPLV